MQHRLGGYREFRPNGAIAAFCEAVWWYKAPRDGAGAVHRVLPDLSVNIEFTYMRDAQGRVCDPKLMVWGPAPTPHLAGYEPGREIVALKVKLEWGQTVTGVAAGESVERAMALDAVQPGLAERIEADLGDEPSMQRVTDVLSNVVARHVAGRLRRAPGVAGRALDVVRGSRGRRGVERIAESMGVSTRYLRRAVERESGETLKRYSRIVRLLRAVTVADSHPADTTVPWAALAVDTGFYDQSHLIRECQDLCGLTPVEILHERRAERDVEITVDPDAP